ncbi:MAG TPA: DNA methyltransferase, partial [Terriglobales bacterium]|nr:DNA methyltransferase [Terriglobales bacterium]
MPTVCDYVLWYARNESSVKYRQIWLEKTLEDAGGSEYHRLELPDGRRRLMSATERDSGVLPAGARQYRQDNIVSQRPPGSFPVTFEGKVFTPITGYWKTGVEGFQRLISAGRIEQRGKMLSYVRFLDDFPVRPLANFWADARFSSRAEDKVYVVQTAGTVIERCLLMTTDPGDLVLDPTCGSGTTAYVAEQWGRRWITTDTSRVSLAIARQRLLTARFDYFKLRDDSKGVASGFRSRLVPHVMLRSIARNANLDPIFAKHEPILHTRLAAANTALKHISEKLRNDLRTKLVLKQRQEGKKAITDADLRRWDLPPQWQHWEVPFDTDPDYPTDLKKAVEEYRASWRAKMDEVNACIAANAEHEELVDKPEMDRKITRVSGPFTVEAIQPPEMSLGDAIEVNTRGFGGEPDELGETFVIREVQMGESAQNVEAYLAKMVDLLKMDGVRFPDNKQMKFTRLDPIYASGNAAGIHAEGRWVTMGESDADPEGEAAVGVVFGPQYGP